MYLGSVGSYQQNRQQNFGMIRVENGIGVKGLAKKFGATVEKGKSDMGEICQIIKAPNHEQENKLYLELQGNTAKYNLSHPGKSRPYPEGLYDTTGQRFIDQYSSK